MSNNPNISPETEKWYEKAKAKIDLFIKSIDPDMKVEIWRPDDSPQDPILLKFSHKKISDLWWSMPIITTDDYIDKTLEGIVRGSYKEQKDLLATKKS